MKTNKAHEWFWLVFSLALLAFALCMTFFTLRSSTIYYFFPLLTSVLYIIRRRQRKKQERKQLSGTLLK